MSRKTRLLAALLFFAAACSEQPAITPPEESPVIVPPGPLAAGPAARALRGERVARLVARALTHPDFRGYLKTALDGSPYREHKLHFQRLLHADRGRAAAEIGRANGLGAADVAAEVAAATEFEIYLPVPAHRAAWTGDENVLVATAIHDREAPVAFDPGGRRYVLSAVEPPATPVIALVPVETNFDGPPARQQCYEDCGGGGLGGGGDGGSSTVPLPGLYMTKSHFVQDFEGWLKGSPEFEVHILGQKGTSDSLTSYQCAGEHAGGPYAFDQNGKDWTGSVLLFSATQIAQYNAAHQNQNFRVFYLEDDDTACQIKVDANRVNSALRDIENAYPGLTGGNDSSNTVAKWYKRARSGQIVVSAVGSLIKTNDEIIGNAVEDVVVGTFYPGFNWFVKTESNITNGWVKLEMK